MTDLTGYVAALLYAMVTALSMSFIHESDQHTPIMVSASWVFLVAILWFSMVNYRRLARLYGSVWNYRQDWLHINVATVINWLATFWALNYISPLLFIMLMMSLLPSATYMINLVITKSKPNMQQCMYMVSLLLLCFVFTAVSGVMKSSHHDLVWGIAITIIATVAGSYYLVRSSVLQQKAKMTAVDILTLRFIMITVVTVTLADKHQLVRAVFDPGLGHMLLLSLVTVILPLYCLQQALRLVGPVNTSFIIPFTPIFSLFIQATFFHESFSLMEGLLVMFISMMLVLGVVSQKRS